jgi:hypothetical protein
VEINASIAEPGSGTLSAGTSMYRHSGARPVLTTSIGIRIVPCCDGNTGNDPVSSATAGRKHKAKTKKIGRENNNTGGQSIKILK